MTSVTGPWRVSSITKANLEIAVTNETWGAPRNYAVGRVRLGDKLILYVSRPPDQGYWGIGTVTGELFFDKRPLWPEWPYPHRFRFTLDEPLLTEPVTKDELFAQLPRRGNKRFEYSQPSGVMRLAPHEFELIEGLMRAHRGRIARMPQ